MFGIETSDESCPVPPSGKADLLASDKGEEGIAEVGDGKGDGKKERRGRHENEKRGDHCTKCMQSTAAVCKALFVCVSLFARPEAEKAAEHLIHGRAENHSGVTFCCL